jgi:chemotaxis protein histidine kinase CheA
LSGKDVQLAKNRARTKAEAAGKKSAHSADTEAAARAKREQEQQQREQARQQEEAQRRQKAEQEKQQAKMRREAKRRAKTEDESPITRERRAETRSETKQRRVERAAQLKREAEQRADAAYEAYLKKEFTRSSWAAALADRIAREVREEPRRARLVLMHIPVLFLASDNAATLRPILSRLEPDIFEARRTAFHVDGFNRAIPGLGQKHSEFLIDRITQKPAAATAILAGLNASRLVQDNTLYAFLWKHDRAAVMSKMIVDYADYINRMPVLASSHAALLCDFIRQDPTQATVILAKVTPASLTELSELRNAIARVAPKAVAAVMVPHHINRVNSMPALASDNEQALRGYLAKDPSFANDMLEKIKPSCLSELPFLRRELAAAEPEFYGRVMAPYYIKQMDNALFPDHIVPPLIAIVEGAPQLAEAMEKRIAPKHLKDFGALRTAIATAKAAKHGEEPARNDARRQTAQTATCSRS